MFSLIAYFDSRIPFRISHYIKESRRLGVLLRGCFPDFPGFRWPREIWDLNFEAKLGWVWCFSYDYTGLFDFEEGEPGSGVLFSWHHTQGTYCRRTYPCCCWPLSPGLGSVCQVLPNEFTPLPPFPYCALWKEVTAFRTWGVIFDLLESRVST